MYRPSFEAIDLPRAPSVPGIRLILTVVSFTTGVGAGRLAPILILPILAIVSLRFLGLGLFQSYDFVLKPSQFALSLGFSSCNHRLQSRGQLQKGVLFFFPPGSRHLETALAQLALLECANDRIHFSDQP